MSSNITPIERAGLLGRLEGAGFLKGPNSENDSSLNEIPPTIGEPVKVSNVEQNAKRACNDSPKGGILHSIGNALTLFFFGQPLDKMANSLRETPFSEFKAGQKNAIVRGVITVGQVLARLVQGLGLIVGAALVFLSRVTTFATFVLFSAIMHEMFALILPFEIVCRVLTLNQVAFFANDGSLFGTGEKKPTVEENFDFYRFACWDLPNTCAVPGFSALLGGFVIDSILGTDDTRKTINGQNLVFDRVGEL